MIEQRVSKVTKYLREGWDKISEVTEHCGPDPQPNRELVSQLNVKMGKYEDEVSFHSRNR